MPIFLPASKIRHGALFPGLAARQILALILSFIAISGRAQTVLGPNPPIELADGINWFAGSGGSAFVTVTDTNPLYQSAGYDGVLSNSAASGPNSGNNADFRAGAFLLHGAETVSISFYYYAPSIKPGDNVRVDLRMFDGSSFVADENQHPFSSGSMTGWHFYQSGPIPVPASATEADIDVSINRFGDDTWSSGVSHFDNFLVTTLAGPPFITAQPFSDTVESGVGFTNNVVVSGPAPLSYQWYRDGARVTDDLNGGTNSYLMLDPVGSQDASSNYCVVVGNNYGAVTSAVVSLSVTTNMAPSQNMTGIFWPENHYLPTFAPPAPRVDCVDMDLASAAEQALFVSLEGIVNRTQPQLACVSSSGEGEFTWLNIHKVDYDTMDGFDAILKYKSNVTGLVVTDPAQPDTLNLATTIAGVKNELIADPTLLKALTNAPYDLTVNDDLRGKFTSADQVYGYLYTNYWSQCTHRIIAGMETGNDWNLRDYLISVKSAVVWLDPGAVSSDANVLNLFLSNMAPVDSIYLGWWPNEGADMNWIAQYGIPVMASDDFVNASVYSGVASPISVPPMPPPPPLQNKVYVSMTLSDGDNAQYMEHAMYINWQSSARGTVPIGWTVQPLTVDFDPAMLDYYWTTATTNDCLVAGPSGAGYTHMEYWSNGNVENYTRAASPYLQRSGIRIASVWDNISTATGDAFATNCPSLLGIFDQNDGYFTTRYQALAGFGFPSSGSYSSSVSSLVNAITNTAASWNGLSPMFIAVQGVAWSVTPADCQAIAAAVDPSRFVFVRPDQQFLLYQESLGNGKGGAPPYLTTPPASQFAAIGDSAAFSAVASGTAPLSYQWRFNGTNIAGATSGVYQIADVMPSKAGNYQVVVANAFGSVTSSVATLTLGYQPLGLNGNGLDWAVNQDNAFSVYSAAAVAGNVLTLTDGSGSEAQSVFFDSPQYIGAFTASFTYQAGGNRAADGVTFCLQNDPRGAAALGGSGGQLGVGGSTAIAPSAELELNLYSGNSENVGYAFQTNGLTGGGGANGNYHPPGNVQINNGNPIAIAINYANPEMTLSFTDTVAHSSFTTNLWVGDLVQALGGPSAYIGFTGADGGATSIQTISNFTFVSMPPASIQSGETNVLVSWPTGCPGYLLMENSNFMKANWIQVPEESTVSNGLNTVSIPEGNGNRFYRLEIPAP